MSLIKKLAEKVMATLGQRGADNGYDRQAGTAKEERSAAQIARVFNELTGHSLSTTDAWTFLQVLKLVRMETQIKMGSGDLLDSCVDMVGYSLLKAETALQDHRPVQVERFMFPEQAPEPHFTAPKPAGVRRIATGHHRAIPEVDLPDDKHSAMDD